MIHTPAEVAQNIKTLIKEKFKDLNAYARHKNITPTQLYNILNGKEYMSTFSALRFSLDFDLNLAYCTRGELPVLSPDHSYNLLLEAATDFYFAVRDEDRIREEYERKLDNVTPEEIVFFKKALGRAKVAKAKAGCELVDLLNIGWGEEDDDYNIVKPKIQETGMKLHEAIEAVLRNADKPLTFTEISKRINAQRLYARKDGKPVPASQISARVNQYPTLFEVNKSTSPVVISLSNKNYQ